MLRVKSHWLKNRPLLLIIMALTVFLSLFGLMTVSAAPSALVISKAFFGGGASLDVVPGTEFTYYITYDCASTTDDCANASIVDQLPPEVEYVDATGPGSHIQNINYNAGTREVTFDFVDPLPSETLGEVEIKVKFPVGTILGTTAVNQATSTSNAIPDTSNAVTATAVGPALEITKDFGGATSLTVQSGEEFTYFIAYRCASIFMDCTSVSVVDELPPELEYLGARGPVADVNTITYNAGTREITFDFVEPLGA
ncbi:MAG: hypothetical protein GY943_04930, partial [Chloroflexi bacterium]|nr:hypothetical protein [Chloroflexota bacterium]